MISELVLGHLMALNPVIATLMLLNSVFVEQNPKTPTTTLAPESGSSQLYENLGQEIFARVKEMQASEEWKDLPQIGIQKLKVRKRDYAFKGSVQAEASPEKLFNEIWFNGERTPEWHRDVASVEILMNVSDHARIQYNTAHEQAGGMVTARDFVILNYYVQEGGAYYIVFKSIDYDGMPEREGYVRATNGVSAMIFEPVDSDPDLTSFTFIMDTDFNLGWVGNMVRGLYPTFVQNYLAAVAALARTLE